MNRKSSVIIIRHGRSLYNVGLTKSFDDGITDFGILQAQTVGQYFGSGNMKTDLSKYVFHVSPFYRCLLTAKYIKEAANGIFANAQFAVNPLVGEYMLAGTDDVLVGNREDEFPEFDWSRFHQHPSTSDQGYLHKAEHGEQFLRRIHSAYDSLDDHSIVVSHGMPCVALGLESQGPLHHIPVWDYSINNCSLTWVVNGRKYWWGRNLHHLDYEGVKITENGLAFHKYL